MIEHKIKEELMIKIIMINIFNTKITPIVLLGNDLRQQQNNKQYHSGKIANKDNNE